MSTMKRSGIVLIGFALASVLSNTVALVNPARAEISAHQSPAYVAGTGVLHSKRLTLHKPAVRDDDPAIPLVTEAIAKSNAGDNQAAVEVATKAITKYPNSAIAYAYRGSFYYMLNKFPEALADENKALSLCPTYAQALKTRAAIHIFGSPQDMQAATEDLTKALASDCSDPVIWYFRGYVRFLANNFAEALPDLCVANDISGGGWFFSHFFRGNTLTYLSMYSVAEPDAQQAIKLDPKSGNGYWLLGYVYEHTNRKPAAAEQYQKAVDAFTAANDTANAEFARNALKRVSS